MNERVTPPAQTPPIALNHREVLHWRNSPVARLLDGSVWILNTWQLDLDCPPSIHSWLDRKLAAMLEQQCRRPVDLDAVHVDFITEQDPAVSEVGHERYELRLSLRQVGRSALDPQAFRALQRCAQPWDPARPDLGDLTVDQLLTLIQHSDWSWDYEAVLHHFWKRHGKTWEILARLSFLHGVHRLHKRKRITRDACRLALDVLGLTDYPTSLQQLLARTPPRRSVLHGVMLNDEAIPGVFHLKSRITGHCYVYVLGEQLACTEYLSDRAPWNRHQVLQALNGSAWHRLHLDLTRGPNRLELGVEISDVFAHLQATQRAFSIEHYDAESAFDLSQVDAVEEWDYLLSPIFPALKAVSSLNYWYGDPQLIRSIPTPLRHANSIMGKWMKRTWGLNLNPAQVFVRYLPGTSITPWGQARIPANHVLVVPDETPVSLSQALLKNFRALQPSGYDDEGGRWVVYNDPKGTGEYNPANELAITAASIEAKVTRIEFLEIMRARLTAFWDGNAPAVERSLNMTLITQAVFGLKSASLSASGFNELILALQDGQQSPVAKRSRWSTLGFPLFSSPVSGPTELVCAGLILLRHPGGMLLYQAGQRTGFVEVATQVQLVEHLRRSAADEHWRKTLLDYVPVRFHPRLDYILRLWGGVVKPPEPVSVLRPWTDQIYNEAAHRALRHEYVEHPVASSPTAFLLDRLRKNSISDAEDSITTAREIRLNDWQQLANRLQLLLAPMALLLPPAAIASLTTGAVSLALDIQAALLPGGREKERRQVVLSTLTLGLLQLGPVTPGLLRAFSRVSTPIHTLRAVHAAPPLRALSRWLSFSTHSRQTCLSPFFNGAGPLKSWRVAGNALYGTAPVRAWKLGRRFLLWTSDQGQARTLVLSSHGHYLPWTRTTAVPNGTQLWTYAPHGAELVDPLLHKVVGQSVQPYSLLDNVQPTPGPVTGPFISLREGHKLMAGTTLPGRIRNYKLTKFQTSTHESYRDISMIVRNSNQPGLPGRLPQTPMDVLSVRNRFGVTSPSLEDLFIELAQHGIHYDRILLVHCRCSAISAVLRKAPIYHAPPGPTATTP